MKFTILGGDLRSVYLVRRLLRDGHRVGTYGLELSDIPPLCRCGSLRESLRDTDCVVLPIPTADGTLLRAPYSCTPIPLDAVAEALPAGVHVFGGGHCGIPMRDLLRDEPLAVGNAALTAQCAVGLLLQHFPADIMGSRVLIIGAGRIGKLLGLRLRALGAEVTVTSRREDDKAWCAALGLKVGDTRDLAPLLPRCDIAVNTVPAPVLSDRDLDLLPQGVLLTELASKPGGFDPIAAEARGIHAVMGGGLPGKYAPKAAADLMAETIYRETEM